MQIVIDIPEGMVKALDQGCFDATYNIYDLCGCVMNGTPLPKGHGRLIDADALDTSILQAGFAYAITRRKLRYTAGDMRQKIANAPTIIEADKEDEDE